MGPGEDYYDRFYRWFSALDAQTARGFTSGHPEPVGWEGFFEMIQAHPWRD